MTKRLQKFFDLHKYFLKDADSIDALIEECRLTQINLGELIELKLCISNEYNAAQRKYEHVKEECRDAVSDSMRKRGIKSTEALINSKMSVVAGDRIDPLKQIRDSLKIELECVQDLYYAMMQRKDILVQIIDRWKFKDEYESCLLKNKEFVEKISQGL